MLGDRLRETLRCHKCQFHLRGKTLVCGQGHGICKSCSDRGHWCVCCSDIKYRPHVLLNDVVELATRWEDNDGEDPIVREYKVASALISSLECPFCYETVSSHRPLHLCYNGHILCDTCFNLIEGCCPLCVHPYPKSEDWLARKVAQLLELTYPCVNSQHGCSVLLDYKLSLKHHLECRYREYRCREEGCRWTGQLPGFIVHSREGHDTKATDIGEEGLRLPLELNGNHSGNFNSEGESGWSLRVKREGEVVAVVCYGSMKEGGLRLVAGLPHCSRSLLYLSLIDRRETIASRVHFRPTSSTKEVDMVELGPLDMETLGPLLRSDNTVETRLELQVPQSRIRLLTWATFAAINLAHFIVKTY